MDLIQASLYEGPFNQDEKFSNKDKALDFLNAVLKRREALRCDPGTPYPRTLRNLLSYNLAEGIYPDVPEKYLKKIESAYSVLCDVLSEVAEEVIENDF